MGSWSLIFDVCACMCVWEKILAASILFSEARWILIRRSGWGRSLAIPVHVMTDAKPVNFCRLGVTGRERSLTCALQHCTMTGLSGLPWVLAKRGWSRFWSQCLFAPVCPVFGFLDLKAASEGSTGSIACLGIWIQELCSARSLHRPQQQLWQPPSLSSRSSLISGRELLEARARVCLHSAPIQDPQRPWHPPLHIHGHTTPIFHSSFCSVPKQQLPKSSVHIF